MMIDELKSFVAVVEEASLTRAAQRLCVTQSAISKRIRRLEDEMGAELLDRQSKPPQLTALARRVYEHAMPLLGAWDRLMGVAREGGEPAGTLRFGLPHGIADLVVFDALNALRAAYPRLEVALRADWSPALARLLDGGELDVAALMTPPGARPTAGEGHRHVATIKLAVVQSRRRPLVARRTDLAAIGGCEWVLNPEGCGYRAALRQAMEASGQALRVKADTHGNEMQLQLIASGFGLGLVPASVVRHSVWKPQLAVVQVADFAPSLDVWLAHPRQLGSLTDAVARLGDTIDASFKAASRRSP